MGVITRNLRRAAKATSTAVVAGGAAGAIMSNNASGGDTSSTTFASDIADVNRIGTDADEGTELDIGGEDRKRRGKSNRGRVSRSDGAPQVSADTAQARANSGTGLMI